MIENAIKIFVSMLATDWAQPDAGIKLLGKPVLLWPAVWPHLENYSQTLSKSDRSRANHLLEYLRYMDSYTHASGIYPIDYGPLEDIHQKYINAEITLTTGILLASTPDRYNLLSPFYVLSRCDQYGIKNGKKRKDLLNQFSYLERIALAVFAITVPIKDEEETLKMFSAPVITALSIATAILTEIPDGAILQRCLKLSRGLELNPICGQENPLLPELYYSIGILYLDSYFSGKSMSNIKELHKAWLKKYYAQSNVDEYVLVNMPDCIEACEQAIFFLEKAFERISEDDKKSVQIALNNALYCRKVLKGGASEKSSILQGFEQDSKGSSSRPEKVADLEHYLKSSPFINSSPTELIEQYGQQKLFVMLSNEIAVYQDDNPHVSYEVYKKAQEILDIYPNEAIEEEHFQRGTQILFKLSLPTIKSQQNIQTEKILNQFGEYTNKVGLSAVDYFSNIITLALLDIRNHQGGPGSIMLLNVIEKIKELNQPLELIPLCQYSYTLSFIHCGIKYYENHQFKESLITFSDGLFAALKYGYLKDIKRLVANIADIGLKGDEEVYFQAVVKLIELNPVFAPIGLSYMDEHLNKAFLKLLARAMNMGKRANLITTLILAAKGFHFRSMLGCEISSSDIWDDKSHVLLREIQSLFNQSLIKFSSLPYKKFSKENLISAYISTSAKIPGNDEFARFSNLQIEFDEYIQRHRIEALPEKHTYFSPDDIQSLLDEDTVFINYFLGETQENNMGIYTNIITKTHYEIALCILPGIPMTPDHIIDGDAQITVSPIALLVSAFRDEIGIDPTEESSIDSNANVKITELANILFSGSIPSSLLQLRESGKRNLCIWPHSVLHYLPFHLLPYEDGLLSDYWSVRIIPDLALLDSSSVTQTSDLLISVMAMSFTAENPLKLPILNEAIVHCKHLASLFNIKPITDRELTKSTFLKKIKQSKWIHLYTHGYLTPGAPSFQCLFLHPSDGDNGIFYAHELIGIDLSNIDLLTLSACETGLGRFDALDNLRGLSANFFVAGVSTIIATLWEAESESSAFFFQHLYECLKSGMNKLDAYTAAQKNTKIHFPEQRDWGAFYYLGK
jgi:CHAT domain-containing protein